MPGAPDGMGGAEDSGISGAKWSSVIHFLKSAVRFNRFAVCVGIGIFAAVAFAAADAGAVVLAWPPNPEGNIAGYRVHFGTASGSYSQTLDVGNVTNVSIPSLTAGTTYFFAVTAYNAQSAESGMSAETTFTEGPSEVQAMGVLPDGRFRLAINGGKGRSNTVQVSSDLKTWTNLVTLANPTGSLTVTDSGATNSPQRYYRVLAESYYLSNVVGYAKASVPAGYSIVANPFVPNTNAVAAVFPSVPAGTTIFKFRSQTGDFLVNTYDGDFQEWQAPTQTFGSGEGAFILNPAATAFQMTFSGKVSEGLLSRALPAGYSMIGSMLPQAGLLQADLGFQPSGGETIFRFRDGSYLINQFDPDFHQWDAEPRIEVAEGFFLLQPTASVWSRTFTATY